MKNLLIYISPTKSFTNPRHDLIDDAGVSVKVQIDNSLELGWLPEDIMLVTNFPFEHNGIKAMVLEVDFFDRKPQASKINAILKLFENGMIEDDEIYWFHDLDAFQLCSIAKLTVDLEEADMALSDYGRNPRWSTGVIYFNKRARDLFEQMRRVTYQKNIDEERALAFLTRGDEAINRRVKKIDKSFNFTPRNLRTMYPLVVKPLRVAHFHPLGTVSRTNQQSAFDFFKGNNSLNLQLVTDRLLRILDTHGVR